MAANTVLPSMPGNSARIVSYTIPAYEPALYPRRNSEPTIYPLTSKIRQEECQEASKLLPMATSNLVKSLMPCSYPGHGGFLCAGVMRQNSNSFRAR